MSGVGEPHTKNNKGKCSSGVIAKDGGYIEITSLISIYSGGKDMSVYFLSYTH